METSQIEAYAGPLVDLIVDADRADALKQQSLDMPAITLTSRQVSDLELLMNGGFSPLRGFLNRLDYESVLDRMRLSDGTLWPIPICLDVSGPESENFESGQKVALRDREGFMLAILHIEDIWSFDKNREADAVYGTRDIGHPGVDYLFNQTGSRYIGGKVEGIQIPLQYAFRRLRRSPAELRKLYRKLGWRRIVGFQTRNPLYRAQFEMTLRAMGQARANLLLHPVVQRVKPGDIDTYTRVRCYLEARRNYSPNMMLLSLLSLAMRMAGPREALLHAIVRKNHGCTHFIVGQDHGGPGCKSDGCHFYEPDAAIQFSLEHSSEIGIEIIPFEEMLYVPDEDAYMPVSEIPEGNGFLRLSDDEFNSRLRAGKRVPEWFSFPEVVEVLRQAHPPRDRQGFTLFCTGLSGAGKSTIAQVLYARFLEMGKRPVTLLDGDIVRTNLSSELGFSKEHRDINVRRIGFVASEITKNRGIAICAPIAPYRETRRQVRRLIETYGGFVEIFVNTPLDVCETRDRKGLYAKARAGIIKGMTGIDDPYESPTQAEVTIDTTELTPDEAAQEVLLFLEREGYIK